MNTSKFLFFLGSIVVITFGTIVFIKNSNDHKECRNLTEYSVSKDGTKIKAEKHICKEKFNF